MRSGVKTLDHAVLATWAVIAGEEEGYAEVQDPILEQELDLLVPTWGEVLELADEVRFILDSERTSDDGDYGDGLQRYGTDWGKATFRKDLDTAIAQGYTVPVMREEQGYSALVMAKKLPRSVPEVLDLRQVTRAEAEQFIDEQVDFYYGE